MVSPTHIRIRTICENNAMPTLIICESSLVIPHVFKFNIDINLEGNMLVNIMINDFKKVGFQ